VQDAKYLLILGTTAELKNLSIRWGSDEQAMREGMKKREIGGPAACQWNL
jgi:hypothetical protein